MSNEQLFIILHKINGKWEGGQPVILEAARSMRDALQERYPNDEIKMMLYRDWQIEQAKSIEIKN